MPERTATCRLNSFAGSDVWIIDLEFTRGRTPSIDVLSAGPISKIRHRLESVASLLDAVTATPPSGIPAGHSASEDSCMEGDSLLSPQFRPTVEMPKPGTTAAPSHHPRRYTGARAARVGRGAFHNRLSTIQTICRTWRTMSSCHGCAGAPSATRGDGSRSLATPTSTPARGPISSACATRPRIPPGSTVRREQDRRA